jgi:hypothetical protein
MTMQVDTTLDEVLKDLENTTISHSNPPAEDPNPVETEALFAQELNKLSMQERDEVLQDIHGVSDIMNEEPAFVRKRFQELEDELSKISDKEKDAYLQAKLLNEEYVTNKKFLLMFLRADDFQVKLVAARIVAFFQAKLELFGPDKLGRDIRLSDLNEDDMRCLESGYAQVLPERDRAGRAIFSLMPMIRAHRFIENKVSVIDISFGRLHSPLLISIMHSCFSSS